MRIIKIIIPCLLLNACMFGTSKHAKFYILTATAAQPVSADYAAFVGVGRIQLPQYVERPQMVVQHKDSSQVNISEYNRWVESLPVLATRVVTENLGALLPAAQIKQNRFKGETFERTIVTEIIKMEAVLGDHAELTAWYTIKDGTGKILVRQKFENTIQIGKTYDELAQSYSQLLAELSREIAEKLIQNRDGSSEGGRN